MRLRDSTSQRVTPPESVNCNVCGLLSSTVPSGKKRMAGKLLNVVGEPMPTFSTAICNVVIHRQLFRLRIAGLARRFLLQSVGVLFFVHPSTIGMPSETARLWAACISENSRRASESSARPRMKFAIAGAASDVMTTSSARTRISSISVNRAVLNVNVHRWLAIRIRKQHVTCIGLASVQHI